MTEVRALEPADEPWLREFVATRIGSERVVSRGVLHSVLELPGLVACRQGRPEALLLYSVVGDQLEVVALYAARSGLGLGSALLDAARREAEARGCRRLWLITTNDNEPAIRFYRARGMALAAVHRGALAESRRLKPEIPLTGVGGAPIEDELEFELPVAR